MGLCSDGDFDGSVVPLGDRNWIVVVKLEPSSVNPDPCVSVYDKVSKWR